MNKIVIYTDGIYDLFHVGHIESLRKCSQLFSHVYLIVGVISDEVASEYKRPPIYGEKDRYEIIRNIKFVDLVVENAPLVLTQEFIEEYQIDYVVHGFSTPEDRNKQNNFYEVPKSLNKFMEINYHQGISTTQIIQKIKNLDEF